MHQKATKRGENRASHLPEHALGNVEKTKADRLLYKKHAILSSNISDGKVEKREAKRMLKEEHGILSSKTTDGSAT